MSGWLSTRQHKIEAVGAVVVVLLILLLVLLLLLNRQRKRAAGGEPEPKAEKPPEPGKPPKPEKPSKVKGLDGVAEQLDRRLAATFDRLNVEERRIDERNAALAASEAEFEKTAEGRIARLTEWEQSLADREARLAAQQAAGSLAADESARSAEEAYRGREL